MTATPDPRPAGPEPIEVNPAPTPFAWGVHRVNLGPDAAPAIMLMLDMVTGRTVVFLDDATAQDMGRQMISKSTGLHLPPPNGSRG